MNKKVWESYEELAQYLLNEISNHFGISSVNGKQCIQGKKSGTQYEIDGKGVFENGEGIIILECRNYTTSRLPQEHIAALAYRIQDAGAKGGIIVSPLGLQKGAKKIAKAENIESVILKGSSKDNYVLVLEFLNKIFFGIKECVVFSDHAELEVIRSKE